MWEFRLGKQVFWLLSSVSIIGRDNRESGHTSGKPWINVCGCVWASDWYLIGLSIGWMLFKSLFHHVKKHIQRKLNPPEKLNRYILRRTFVAFLGISTTHPLYPNYASLISQTLCEMRVFVWMICIYYHVWQWPWLCSVCEMLSRLFPPSTWLNLKRWNRAMANIHEASWTSLAKCVEIRCNCSYKVEVLLKTPPHFQ